METSGNFVEIQRPSVNEFSLSRFELQRERYLWVPPVCEDACPDNDKGSYNGMLHTLRADIRAKLYSEDSLLPEHNFPLGEDLLLLLKSAKYRFTEENKKVQDILYDGLDEICYAFENNNIDFVDRILVDTSERAMDELGKNSLVEQDYLKVVEFQAILEQLWLNNRGQAFAICVQNASHYSLRFQLVVYASESTRKIWTLLSDALCIPEDQISIFKNGVKVIKGAPIQDQISIERTGTYNSYLSQNSHLFEFTIFEGTKSEDVLSSSHFFEDIKNKVVKEKAKETLSKMFHIHAPDLELQSMNKLLMLLGFKFSEFSNLSFLRNNPLMDINLFMEIFSFYEQRPTMDRSRIAQHILSCGIAPGSASANSSRLDALLKTYGKPVSELNNSKFVSSIYSKGVRTCVSKQDESYELDFDGFVRFYADAFVDRPMLSWYDYLAYGYSHDFQSYAEVTPLFLRLSQITRSNYQSYRLDDVFLETGSRTSESRESVKTSPPKNVHWYTNRVEYTIRGILERPCIRNRLEIVFERILKSESADFTLAKRVLSSIFHNERAFSGRIAPVAAVYL